MHQVVQGPVAEIVIQDSARFREDLLHFGGIWIDGQAKPLCLQWERRMLRQDTTKKNRRGNPAILELPLSNLRANKLSIRFPPQNGGILKMTEKLTALRLLTSVILEVALTGSSSTLKTSAS